MQKLDLSRVVLFNPQATDFHLTLTNMDVTYMDEWQGEWFVSFI
jgi:hypothetical protein